MADKKETILLQLELDLSKMTSNLQKAIEDFTILSGRQKDLKKQMDELRATGQESGATFQNLSKEYADNKVRLSELRAEQSQYEKQIKLVNTANKEEEGSIGQLRAQLALATIEYNKMSEEQRENSEEGKKLSTSIKAISDKLKEQEGAIGDTRRNVGNYKEALQGLFTLFEGAASKVESTQNSIDDLNKTFGDGQGDQKEYNQRLKELTDELGVSTLEMNKLGGEIDELKSSVDSASEPFKSLKQQLKEAKDEAQLLQDQFEQGLIPEATLISAQQKVADIAEKISDFNQRVEALNPEAKFKSITQAAGALSAGVGGISASLQLVGVDSSTAVEGLQKLQQIQSIVQAFDKLAEVPDIIKNMTVAFRGTTAATQVQTVAQAENTVVTEANAAAKVELSTVQTGATATTKGLSVAMNGLSGPLGLVVIGIAAVVAAFKIYDEIVKQVGEDTENLIDSSNLEVEASKHALEVRKESIARTSENAQQQLDLAKSQGKAEADLLQQKKQNAVLTQNLQDDLLDENQKAIDTLTNRQERLAENSAHAADEDERKKIQATQQTVKAQIDILTKANEQILEEQKKQDNDLTIEENTHKESIKKIAEETVTLKISLIKDSRTREIESERESLREKLTELQKNEAENQEKIIAVKSESAEKLKVINQKFDLQELQERNQLEINSTIEGTDARLQAEASAASRLRDLKLNDDKLTNRQRLIIEQDFQIQMEQIKNKELDLQLERNRNSLQLTQDLRDAEFAVQKQETSSNDPQSQLLIKLHEIHIETQKELENRNQQREEDLVKNDQFVNSQLQQLQFSQEFKKKTVDEQTAEINHIIEEGRQKEETINTIANEQNLATTIESTNAIVQVTADAEQQKLDLIVQSKQLALDAANPEEEFQARRDLLDAQYQAEVEAANKSIQNAENREQTISDLNKRYAKVKMLLDDEQSKHAQQNIASTLGQAATLFKKHTAAYKILATSEAIINTYLAATQAYLTGLQAGYPVGLVLGPVMAGVAIATGLANVAQINGVQFYSGGFDRRYGYTGTGDPRGVSHSHSTLDRTIHNEEYIIDHRTLKDPDVNKYVHSVIEPKRLGQNLSSIQARRYESSVSSHRSFAVGGFSDSIILNNTPVSFNVDALQSAFDNSIAKIPQQILVVEEVSGLQDQQVLVKSRANS